MLAIPLAGLVAIPVAALGFRLAGAHFAIGSWVMAEVFRLIAAQATVLGICLPAQITRQLGGKRLREATIYGLALGSG